MLTVLTTWISERIITVTAATVLTVAAILAEQGRCARLEFVTPQDEDNELEHLKLIEIIALGDGQSAGTITVTCQTVLITITQTIQITIVQTAPAPCPPREERDDD